MAPARAAASLFALTALLAAAGVARPAAASEPAVRTSSRGSSVECPPFECRVYGRVEDAFSDVLARRPRVLAIGEVHETTGAPKVRSAIHRFNRTMLPLLRHRASDLIVETWVPDGRCGQVEEQAVAEIKQETRRPETTEDEIVRLIRSTLKLDIMPHILEVSCQQYREVLGPDGELDDDRLLRLVAKLLIEKAENLYDKNQARGSERMIVVYGGAIHNDTNPPKDVAPYSFGSDLSVVTEGRYVELDLFVPELIEKDEMYAAEPWFPWFKKLASKRRTLLIRTRPETFLFVFPRSR